METIQNDDPKMKQTATQSAPFGPGFDQETVEQADSMQVWGSSFDDPGADFVEFQLFNGDKMIAKKRVGGY